MTSFARPGGTAPTKILIVDDNRDICHAVGAMLEPMGAEIHSAFNGAEALGVLEKGPIDLAIVDLLFAGPVSSDLVVQQAKFRNCKVITMSGTLASDRRGRDLRHPHIVKPFGSLQLVELVESTLAESVRPALVL
jgi:DNA-binding NtrC family response regulator